MRVTKTHHREISSLRDNFGTMLNITFQRSRYLDTDLENPCLRFSEDFFRPRSIAGWLKLSRHFAKLCAAMHEVKQRSGLKQAEIHHEHRYDHLVPVNFVTRHGDALELAPI